MLETESAAHSSYLLEGIYHFPQQIKGVTQTMKRLVSVFLVLCMMLSCVAFGETLDGAGSCGGCNLHWAFGSGLVAGRSAAGHAAAGRALPKAPAPAKSRKKPHRKK